jgi:hypothetical protein
MAGKEVTPEFPAGLVDWAGHRSGGVRRMFDAGSGRPAGVFKTSLLRRLDVWATELVREGSAAPTLILLVGGPGNGKTEAVEATIGFIDAAAGHADGRLADAFAKRLSPAPGVPVPRVAPVTLQLRASDRVPTTIAVVQDASVKDSARPDKAPSELLLEELECFLQPSSGVYIACVNRGILDDALILAVDQCRTAVCELLEGISRAVAVTATAGSCWPLQGFPRVAIWPMDAESLLVCHAENEQSPAGAMLDAATSAQRWPAEFQCAAGLRCPFCHSRKVLSAPSGAAALLKILRYHELGTGKRWSFRDLFSLIPQLLAQVPEVAGDGRKSPCEWAAEMLTIDRGDLAQRSERVRSTAIYSLVAASYQHVLFGEWSRDAARQIQADIREVNLAANLTLQGLVHFLRSSRTATLPSTLKPLLAGLCQLLDPALADSEGTIQISSSKVVRLGEVDARFSQSVTAGLEYLIGLRCLSPLERELLGRLGDVDSKLDGDIRISRPVASRRLQRTLREFSCRLARRSLGARYGYVQDGEALASFQQITDSSDDQEDLLIAAAKNVEQLLNLRGSFEIALNTTFGEPLPPATRRATLVAPKQRVRARVGSSHGRPPSPFRYLTIGVSANGQPIPLTYELYKAVSDLGNGLMQASLPTSVVALLDSTKARLAGALVRSGSLLEDARIAIGTSRENVVIGPKGFLVQREETSGR